mmetsp:Transcript_80648/g.224444  ORF Transcript_80648/g.224444 Transcript_80648/m.224444 type:complete len:326 (+) Transcript_80648:753-1730(+)
MTTGFRGVHHVHVIACDTLVALLAGRALDAAIRSPQLGGLALAQAVLPDPLGIFSALFIGLLPVVRCWILNVRPIVIDSFGANGDLGRRGLPRSSCGAALMVTPGVAARVLGHAQVHRRALRAFKRTTAAWDAPPLASSRASLPGGAIWSLTTRNSRPVPRPGVQGSEFQALRAVVQGHLPNAKIHRGVGVVIVEAVAQYSTHGVNEARVQEPAERAAALKGKRPAQHQHRLCLLVRKVHAIRALQERRQRGSQIRLANGEPRGKRHDPQEGIVLNRQRRFRAAPPQDWAGMTRRAQQRRGFRQRPRDAQARLIVAARSRCRCGG